MFVSTFTTFINPLQSYSALQRTAPLQTEQPSAFVELLAQKQLSAYTLNRSFPVDYVNKESTLFNQLRMQTPQDSQNETSLQASLHVSSFDILNKRTQSYEQNFSKTKSLYKHQQPLSCNLGNSNYSVQKQKIASIYTSNDNYFNLTSRT
jgi:hypothetical protein